MKKTASMIAVAAIIILTFSSCNRCTTCSKSGGSISTVCRNSYSSDSQYNAAVDTYENTGYNCN